MPGGNYELLLGDACNLLVKSAFAIGETPAPFWMEGFSVTHPCEGTNEGAINIQVHNPLNWNLDYAWSNGAQTEDISGLSPGAYMVTISASNGCQVVHSFFVVEKILTIEGAIVSNSCIGQATGSISLDVNGFWAPIEYQWSNGLHTDAIDGLSDGAYCVTITSEDCAIEECFDIDDIYPLPQIRLDNIQFLTTNTPPNGSIAVSGAPASQGPFSYAWSNGGNSNSVSGLNAGIYTVTVENQYGCTNSGSYEIGYCNEYVLDPGHPTQHYEYPFQIGVLVTPLTAPEANDGRLDIITSLYPNTPPGYIPEYFFTWTGPNGFLGNSQVISGLAEGEYCVTVTNGCYTESLCQLVAYCGDFTVEGEISQNGYDPPCLYPGSPGLSLTAVTANPNGMVTYNWWDGASNNQRNYLNWDKWYQYLNAGDFLLIAEDEATCKTEFLFPVSSLFPGGNYAWDYGYFDLSDAADYQAYNYFSTFIQTNNYPEGLTYVMPFVEACEGYTYCNGQYVSFWEDSPIGCWYNDINNLSQELCSNIFAHLNVVCGIDPGLSTPVTFIANTIVDIPVGNNKCRRKEYFLYTDGERPFVFSKVLNGPFSCNPNQDYDNDGLVGDDDGCPTVYNPGQYDCDNDGTPDACDPTPGEGYQVVPSLESCENYIYCGPALLGIEQAPTYEVYSVDYSENHCERTIYCSLTNEPLEVFDETRTCKANVGQGCKLITYCYFLDNPQTTYLELVSILDEEVFQGADCNNDFPLVNECPPIAIVDPIIAPPSGFETASLGMEKTISVFPNPTKGDFTVVLQSSQETTIFLEVFNATGIKLFNREYQAATGVSTFEISLERPSPGLYFLIFKDEKGNVEKKTISVVD